MVGRVKNKACIKDRNIRSSFDRQFEQISKVRRIIVLLLLFIVWGVSAQEKEPANLFTDRDLYTSGETLLFTVCIPGTETTGTIKVNLLNTQGKIISEVSKKIENHQAEGYFYLTDSLKTGTYLLCTTFKNSSLSTIKELFIYNRFTGFSETTSILRPTETVPLIEKAAEGVTIDGLNPSCTSRQKVTGNIHLSNEFLSQLSGSLLLTVAGINPDYSSQTFYKKNSSHINNLKEKEGIILDGYAIHPKSGAPFQNGCIMLSVPDSIPWLDYCMTDENGFFSFKLDNYYGKIPVILQGYDLNKKQLLKIILNRTDSLPHCLPTFERKTLSPALSKYASEDIEATTLRKIYHSQELNFEEIPIVNRHLFPFYGVPTETVYPRLFIDLPDFTEISRELLPGVKFRAYNRIPTIQILNPTTHNFSNDPTLVTVHVFPVRDLNIIKNLGSKEIERIEICRKERFYGDLVFPGVVAIFLYNHDFKLLPESDELIKLALDAVQPGVTLNATINPKRHEPDLRKVLLWKSIHHPEQSLQFEFTTSDIQGLFKLVVRGKRTDGSVVYKEQIFEVK